MPADPAADRRVLHDEMLTEQQIITVEQARRCGNAPTTGVQNLVAVVDDLTARLASLSSSPTDGGTREALQALVDHLGRQEAASLRHVNLSFWPKSNSVLVKAVDALAASPPPAPVDHLLREALRLIDRAYQRADFTDLASTVAALLTISTIADHALAAAPERQEGVVWLGVGCGPHCNADDDGFGWHNHGGVGFLVTAPTPDASPEEASP